MSINRGALVKVKWEDPTSQSSWMSHADLVEFMTDETFIAESIGWVVYEDDTGVAIAATVTTNNEYIGQVFRIPRTAIKEVIKL